jgi:hypothetical protein
MNRLEKLALGCLACGVAVASQADVVYDNLSTTPFDFHIGGFPYAEVADDVFLGPGSRAFQQIEVRYFGGNFDGDETLTLTLYSMDGAPTPGSFGFNTPGSVLFSETQAITAGDNNAAIFSDLSGSILLPEHVGIGYSFGGVDFDPDLIGSDAGPLLYEEPTVGAPPFLDDYWLRGYPDPADDWGLFTLDGDPPVFLGMTITTGIIPEPGTWVSMGGLVMLAGMILVRRFRRS